MMSARYSVCGPQRGTGAHTVYYSLFVFQHWGQEPCSIAVIRDRELTFAKTWAWWGWYSPRSSWTSWSAPWPSAIALSHHQMRPSPFSNPELCEGPPGNDPQQESVIHQRTAYAFEYREAAFQATTDSELTAAVDKRLDTGTLLAYSSLAGWTPAWCMPSAWIPTLSIWNTLGRPLASSVQTTLRLVLCICFLFSQKGEL